MQESIVFLVGVQCRRNESSRSGARSGVMYAQGPHVTYGKKFLVACRCMTVVVL